MLSSHWDRGPTGTVRYKELYNNSQWVRLTHAHAGEGRDGAVYVQVPEDVRQAEFMGHTVSLKSISWTPYLFTIVDLRPSR